MNRRNFLSLFSAGVAGIALAEAIPLGRVWSFPKKIVIAKRLPDSLFYGVDWGFGISRSVSIREYWRRHPNGEIWSRREVVNPNGTPGPEIHGWVLTGYAEPPILTAAFPPDSSRTPS